jgi:hypothetical protein
MGVHIRKVQETVASLWDTGLVLVRLLPERSGCEDGGGCSESSQFGRSLWSSNAKASLICKRLVKDWPQYTSIHDLTITSIIFRYPLLNALWDYINIENLENS